MPLGSVLHTALSGMSAATATVDAVSHNLANLRTNGFKAVRPVFATQVPATYGLGDSPTAASGGGNPLQVGTGVRVVGYVTDNSQGPLVVGADGELVELSNTDVGNELVNLILARNQFRANAAVFDTTEQLLDELVVLGRARN